MTSSISKRRYSERSPSTTSVTGENEDSTAGGEGDSSAESHLTEMQQPDPSDIRLEMNPIGATENFADLPDPEDDKLSPDEFLHKLVFATCGMELEPKKAKSLKDFFEKVTDAQVAAYTMAVVSACRNNDLDALKKLHSEEGQTLNCFNRFGESLLTMACRRGFEDVVEYLLQQAGVDVRISDDSGRTVLHDACWNPSPQLRICGWITDRDPALWFVADNRGCTPFQYARPEHWGIWRQFLLDHKGALQLLRTDDIKSKLSKQTQ
ncbi:unnamed protein product [Pseudo-nitzschia multistriata]|uniref:Uncharacterized protein n=1 Tax=Pseudo-nitzschia multistriata TaxID=183589 RepID=A0A448Z8V2_9STRA|nr:unnamed protein product [Pseudo-nitzschia multistriata]